MGFVIDVELNDGQEALWEKLFKKNCFRFKDAANYVRALTAEEVAVVSAALDDPNGPYFHTALEQFRAKQSQMAQVDAAFVQGQAGLVAANEALVMQNRQQVPGV